MAKQYPTSGSKAKKAPAQTKGVKPHSSKKVPSKMIPVKVYGKPGD